MKKSEFEIAKEVAHKLGLENLTDGTIKRYKKIKGIKHDKPDGVFEYRDIILVLDAKSEGGKYVNQLSDYIRGEKTLNPDKQVFGIFYNGVEHWVCLNNIDNILKDATVLADKEYYYNLAHNKELDKTEIYTMTRNINNTLNNMGLSNLLQRMVWTVCLLVASRKHPLKNTEKSYETDVVNYLNEAIGNDILKNKKLEILIDEFKTTARNINYDKEKLEKAIDVINSLSDLLNSSKWNGEDVGAIFFNEFTRYKGKAQDGQVFTPEIWTGFMYKLIGCNYQDRILDAACGSAGFLVKAMNLMTEESPQNRIDIHTKRLFGVEWSKQIYAVACANMLLHKDGKSNIIQGDTTNENPLTIEAEPNIKNVGDWIKSKRITKVLMNPPFEGSKGIKILNNVLNNVQPNSDVAFIMPDRTLLTKSSSIVKQILLKHRLTHIIKMPDETWRGMANTKTSIFVFKTGIPHKNSDIVKYWIKEDGMKTVKNSGRHDIDKIWATKLENYWLDIILNNKDHETKQVSKSLEYEIEKAPLSLTEADFDKVILDRILFENPEIKEKVEKIKEKDWLLWSLKSPKKEEGEKK